MRTLAQVEIEEIYTYAVQLGKDAGQLLLEGVKARTEGDSSLGTVIEKENAVDIVTQIDEGTIHAPIFR